MKATKRRRKLLFQPLKLHGVDAPAKQVGSKPLKYSTPTEFLMLFTGNQRKAWSTAANLLSMYEQKKKELEVVASESKQHARTSWFTIESREKNGTSKREVSMGYQKSDSALFFVIFHQQNGMKKNKSMAAEGANYTCWRDGASCETVGNEKIR